MTVVAADDDIYQTAMDEIEQAVTFCRGVIKVPQEKIGRVIGRGGETLRQIQEETDTRVFVSRDSEGTIEIEGHGKDAVQQAIDLIEQRIDDVTVVSITHYDLPEADETRAL